MLRGSTDRDPNAVIQRRMGGFPDEDSALKKRIEQSRRSYRGIRLDEDEVGPRGANRQSEVAEDPFKLLAANLCRLNDVLNVIRMTKRSERAG